MEIREESVWNVRPFCSYYVPDRIKFDRIFGRNHSKGSICHDASVYTCGLCHWPVDEAKINKCALNRHLVVLVDWISIPISKSFHRRRKANLISEKTYPEARRIQTEISNDSACISTKWRKNGNWTKCASHNLILQPAETGTHKFNRRKMRNGSKIPTSLDLYANGNDWSPKRTPYRATSHSYWLFFVREWK